MRTGLGVFRTIRSSFVRVENVEHVVVVDQCWVDRAIDVRVSDLIVLPAGAELEGPCVDTLEGSDGRVIARAVRPGIGRVTVESVGWAAFVRVSRRGYVGRSVYRFEEEVDDG
jgi:hypothetical protein